ncbi:MAG: hypothetical protein KDD55_04970 [Bdellovibrionales bacterium]|nr:hypothetical protein [Bdellovibrionales bacterium]
MSSNTGDKDEAQKVEGTKPKEAHQEPLKLVEEPPSEGSSISAEEPIDLVEDNELLIEEETDGSSVMDAIISQAAEAAPTSSPASPPAPSAEDKKEPKKKEKGKRVKPEKSYVPRGKRIGSTEYFSQSGGKHIVGPNDDMAAYQAACSEQGPWHGINLGVVGWHKRTYATRHSDARYSLGFREQLPALSPAAAKRLAKRLIMKHTKQLAKNQKKESIKKGKEK